MKFITPDYITLIIRRTGMPVTQHAQKSPSQQPLSENHLLPVYGVAEIFNTDAAHTIFLHRIVKMRTYRLHGYPQPVCQKGKPVVMENNPEDHHHLCPGQWPCRMSEQPRSTADGLPDICQASHRGNRNDKKPTPTEHRVCKPFQITVTENHITVFGK